MRVHAEQEPGQGESVTLLPGGVGHAWEYSRPGSLIPTTRFCRVPQRKGETAGDSHVGWGLGVDHSWIYERQSL